MDVSTVGSIEFKRLEVDDDNLGHSSKFNKLPLKENGLKKDPKKGVDIRNHQFFGGICYPNFVGSVNLFL